MIDQVVGNGANLFVLIVAVLIGFVGALGYIDKMKVDKEQNGDKH